MASLLGKADATIAGMSYREAMADVTPDLKGVYQDKVLNQAMFQKGVEDHFDTLYADNNLLADQLKEATTLAMANLGTDYEGMELFNTALTSMKTRMKALPKGKKGDFERAKIRGEMAELKRSTDGMEATQTMLGTMIEAGDFDPHATGKVNLSLLNAIASGDAKRKIVNGKLFYSFENPAGGKDIEIDQQALKDMLIQTDPEHQGNFNKIHEGENAQGKIKGNKFDRQGSINKYKASFPSEKAFATNVNNPQGNLKYSFAESLQGKDGSESIYKTLMSMGETTIAKYDADGDGDVDAADFMHPDNGVALIESLTDIHSDNFDYATAKEVAAEFYADNISAKEFQDGVNMRVKTGAVTDKKEINNLGIPDYTFPKFGSGKVDSYDARTLKRRLLDGTSFNFNPTGNQDDIRSYDFIGGSWYENYEDENNKGVNVGNADDMVLEVLKTNHEAFQGLSTSVPEETINIEGETKDVKTEKDLHAGIFSKLDLGGDNTVSKSLNDYFGLSGKRKTLQFRPYSGLAADDALRRSMGADAIYTNDIMLYNPQTGKRVTDANGDTIRFKIGDDMNNLDEVTGLSKDVAKILEVLKQNGVQPPTQLP